VVLNHNEFKEKENLEGLVHFFNYTQPLLEEGLLNKDNKK
jgi:hypothetical protein